MFDSPDHPFERGCTLEFALAADPAEAETFYGRAHAGGGADRALYKFNANGFAHDWFTRHRLRRPRWQRSPDARAAWRCRPGCGDRSKLQGSLSPDCAD